MRYRHVALFVGDDLEAAEAYYVRLFDMDVIVREGPLPTGEWGQLPGDRTWADARAAGTPIAMVALQRDDVILPLFAAAPTGERFYAIGLVMTAEEIDAVASRLEAEMIEEQRADWLAFIDRHGVRWQLSTTAPFRGAGERAGRWLDV